MSLIYEQAVIRAQLSILSNPPVSPLDINTQLAPRFWRASGIEIDVGIFDGSNVGLDLSNLASMTLTLQPSPTSLVPWVVKTVLSGGISSPIDYGAWIDGTEQNASFILTPADTDVGLLARGNRQFWMQIQGFTEDGNYITYGAGYITIYNPGNLPPGIYSNDVSYHRQVVSAPGNFNITPTSVGHTEKVTFPATSGTYNCVLQSSGYPIGSGVDVIAKFPTPTAGLVINFYSGSLTGSPIYTFTTDAYQPNGLFRIVLNDSLAYEMKEVSVPAFQ